MMPGGDAEAYAYLQPIVEKVAAQTDDGPCVTYIGKGGSGECVGAARRRSKPAQRTWGVFDAVFKSWVPPAVRRPCTPTGFSLHLLHLPDPA